MHQHVAGKAELRPFDGYRSFCVRPPAQRIVTRLQDGRLSAMCGDALLLVGRAGADTAHFGALILIQEITSNVGDATDAVLGALEAISAWHPALPEIGLAGLPAQVARRLCEIGAVVDREGSVRCKPEMLWQLPALWLGGESANGYPTLHTFTGDRCHPVRPPKPRGMVYARYVPWLDAVFSLRVETLEEDLARFHVWMNDPRIAEFWMEAGDLDHHTRYFDGLIRDPHMIPIAGCIDSVPFMHFEIYWAKENRLGPFYGASDHDRGWHALVGDERYRGKSYLMAWFTAILHYQFLDESRTWRIVGEPQFDHHRQIANLERAGFSKIKEFDFPHKRALLVELTRERYFGERFYGPRAELLQTLAQ